VCDRYDGYDRSAERADAHQLSSYRRKELVGEAKPRSADPSYPSYLSYPSNYLSN